VSEVIARRTQDLLRQQVIHATREAARADNVAVNADALAFLLDPRAMFLNAPIAGLEKLDFKAILHGQSVLDDTPIMYCQLSGPAFEEGNTLIPAGFYTVVADAKRGAASLRTADGTTVAEGDLGITVTTVAKSSGPTISGGVSNGKVTWGCVEFDATVTVTQSGHSVTITVHVKACIF
jgi:hypothetical protein